MSHLGISAVGTVSPTAPSSPIVYAFKILEEAMEELHAAGVQAHYSGSNLFAKLVPVMNPHGLEAYLAPSPFKLEGTCDGGVDAAPSAFVQHLGQITARIRAEILSLDDLQQRLVRAEQITEL